MSIGQCLKMNVSIFFYLYLKGKDLVFLLIVPITKSYFTIYIFENVCTKLIVTSIINGEENCK